MSAPFVIVIMFWAKPLTFLLNSILTSKTPLTGVVGPETAMLGFCLSYSTVNTLEAVLGLLAVSVSRLAATLTVTSPLLVGDTSTVYSELLVVAKLLNEALVTVISSVLKPVTASLKVKVAVKSVFTADVGPVTTIWGPTVS